MFTFDPSTQAVLKDGQPLGTVSDEGVLTHAAKIAPAHKAQIRKLLEAEGFKAVTFALAASEPEKAQADPEAGADPPPCPPQDLRWGDKTPAVVAWYREHRPEEFARKYRGRKVA